MIKNITKLIVLAILTSFSFSGLSFADNYCGDGILNENLGEQCDDGNFINRDGCSAYCMTEDMTAPEVVSVSIAEDATEISSLTNVINLTFSEKVDVETINDYNVKLKQFTTELDIDYDLQDDGITLIINISQDLIGEKEHSIVIKNVKDIAGNQMLEIFVRSFTAGVSIDHTPPNIVVYPKSGTYNFPQSVTLTPYIGNDTYSEDFLDIGAVIRYTVDGSTPSTESEIFTESFSIHRNATLKYFGVDTQRNSTSVQTQTYQFECAVKSNATKVSPYPTCQIQECNYGFLLKNNVCIINLNADDDYKANAATAPLFGSDTPMTISTKPALYITAEHRGVIPRPILFKDYVRGTTIEFERDTEIKFADGRAFAGYIMPPVNMYTKDFPIFFGYTFKSIFKFQNDNDDTLSFNPPYKILIPFTDRYDEGVDVAVFKYDSKTEIYSEYDPSLYYLNGDGEHITIISSKTNSFFVAQEGRNFNKTVFTDTINHWAQNYIEALYRKDIVKGRDQGIFAPDEFLTRAEFTKIALKSISEEIDLNEEIVKVPFEDTPLDAWYVSYIERAKEIGLIHGYPDGTFKPDQPIIKVEAIKILMNAFEFDLENIEERTDSFRDIDVQQWYYPAVHFAIENKLADGRRLSSGIVVSHAFDPGSNITRAEMAKMAIKTIEFEEDS